MKKTFSYIGASKQITAATVFLVRRKMQYWDRRLIYELLP